MLVFTRLQGFSFLLCFLHGMSLSSAAQKSSGCVLDFDHYPYEPSGECIRKTEKVKQWDSISTNRCCENGLDSLSQALALQAVQNDSLFINDEQWRSCKLSVHPDLVAFETCHFDGLYRDSSKCSSLSRTTLKQTYQEQYQYLRNNCSQFDSSSFINTCGNCARSFEATREVLLEDLSAKDNGTEKDICGLSLVIALTADNIENDTWIREFYTCLRGLDQTGSNYFKIKKSIGRAILGVSVAAMGIILIVILVKFVTQDKKSAKPIEVKETSKWSGLYRFSKAEIEKAINYTTHKVALGSGSAGRVYKGVLPSGQPIAIKHIFKGNMSDSFTREVEGLSRIRHPNLVCLFGCCVDGEERYLVYEYCSNGNLAQSLLRSDTVLPWAKRVKILRDCAVALRFLHTYPDGCIVHRDIKLTNILLTEDMESKLSDFGLAKMIGMEESKVFTDVRGTIGYMDPEYMTNAKLTSASDVYSFGIVALQMLSGRRVIELDLDARDHLTKKAKDVAMKRRPLSDFEDPRLNGDLVTEDFESILQVAVLCVAKSSKGRPNIEVVFREMDKAWKNTSEHMQNRNKKFGMHSSNTPASSSLELMPV